jgi:hypothetical protein
MSSAKPQGSSSKLLGPNWFWWSLWQEKTIP